MINQIMNFIFQPIESVEESQGLEKVPNVKRKTVFKKEVRTCINKERKNFYLPQMVFFSKHSNS